MTESRPTADDPARLEGRTALVTGSTRGLGKAVALELARRGARVAMNYHGDPAAAERAFAELTAIGGEHRLVRGDVTDPASVTRLLAEVCHGLGPVDILVPNATCAQPLKPLEEYDWEFFQRMVDFFQKSPFLLTQGVVPEMKRRGWGRIVHIASEVVAGAWANFAPYVSAKGGQIGLARSNATELAPHGITVNIVAPGWVPVERHEHDPPEAKAAYVATVPMGRFGEPRDVAQAVAYFASDAARFVTGSTLYINGGRVF